MGLGVAMRTAQTLFELTDVSAQLTSFHSPSDRTRTQSSLLLMLLGSPLFQFAYTTGWPSLHRKVPSVALSFSPMWYCVVPMDAISVFRADISPAEMIVIRLAPKAWQAVCARFHVRKF